MLINHHVECTVSRQQSAMPFKEHDRVSFAAKHLPPDLQAELANNEGVDNVSDVCARASSDPSCQEVVGAGPLL